MKILDILNAQEITEIFSPVKSLSNELNGFVFPGKKPIPIPLQEFLSSLKSELKNIEFNKELSISKDGVLFSCIKVKTFNGDYFVFKYLNSEVKSLSKLGLNEMAKEEVLSHACKKGGIIAVTGNKYKVQGLSLSIVTERLRLFGGVAITIEDTPSNVIQGTYGQGFCFQMNVTKKEDYPEVLNSAINIIPEYGGAIFYLNNILDKDLFERIINLSEDNLVIIGIETEDSIPKTINSLIKLLGKEEFKSRKEIADNLRIIINDTLLENSFLVNSKTINSLICTGNIDEIENELKRQKKLSDKNLSLSDILRM